MAKSVEGYNVGADEAIYSACLIQESGNYTRSRMINDQLKDVESSAITELSSWIPYKHLYKKSMQYAAYDMETRLSPFWKRIYREKPAFHPKKKMNPADDVSFLKNPLLLRFFPFGQKTSI